MLANGSKDTDRFSRSGVKNNYRYKGRVTSDKEKQRQYSPFTFRERAEVGEDQDVPE